MRARLGFSIATSVEPDILLLDEVLATGDAAFREKSKARVLELVREAKAIVLVTHDMNWVDGVLQPGDPDRARAGSCTRARPPRSSSSTRSTWPSAGPRRKEQGVLAPRGRPAAAAAAGADGPALPPSPVAPRSVPPARPAQQRRDHARTPPRPPARRASRAAGGRRRTRAGRSSRGPPVGRLIVTCCAISVRTRPCSMVASRATIAPAKPWVSRTSPASAAPMLAELDAQTVRPGGARRRPTGRTRPRASSAPMPPRWTSTLPAVAWPMPPRSIRRTPSRSRRPTPRLAGSVRLGDAGGSRPPGRTRPRRRVGGRGRPSRRPRRGARPPPRRRRRRPADQRRLRVGIGRHDADELGRGGLRGRPLAGALRRRSACRRASGRTSGIAGDGRIPRRAYPTGVARSTPAA